MGVWVYGLFVIFLFVCFVRCARVFVCFVCVFSLCAAMHSHTGAAHEKVALEEVCNTFCSHRACSLSDSLVFSFSRHILCFSLLASLSCLCFTEFAY